MDKSVQVLCQTIKKIIGELKPSQHTLSYLLLVGKTNQGKETLLKQSMLEHVNVDLDAGMHVFFNQRGIIVSIDECWLNQSKQLLQHTLKALNRCHRTLKISGIILCIDINELLHVEPLQFLEQAKSHIQLLNRYGANLTPCLDLALLFTKVDAIAGFCEFFQTESETDHLKPFGFSLIRSERQHKITDIFKKQFDHLIEVLSQNTIKKMHPVRSSLKRTLIREFPLQIASLKTSIQCLVQLISPKLFRLQAIYFVSAQQGGISVDRINRKIQQDYALAIANTFTQAENYRVYFVNGAIDAFQAQTQHVLISAKRFNHWSIALLATGLVTSMIFIVQHHFKSAKLLDEASKELLMYESMAGGASSNPPALYHLTQAANAMRKIGTDSISLPTVELLKNRLQMNAQQTLQGNFIPSILAELEQSMNSPQVSHFERYQALKVYLMLNNPQKFSQQTVMDWFKHRWQQDSPSDQDKKRVLLEHVIHQPFQPIAINQQLVRDTRNYLNALPTSYFYYSLAKPYFPTETQPITVDGFQVASSTLPIYFTKLGFENVLAKIPQISQTLYLENWVLENANLPNEQALTELLEHAYCYDYVTWWNQFTRNTRPHHFQDYFQAQQETKTLAKADTFLKLVQLIQEHTAPNLNDSSPLFNQEIASQFTAINLLSPSVISELNIQFSELERFLATLSVTQDQGKTAFMIVKSRFSGDLLTNPLNVLYARAQQLPEPMNGWIQQIADDSWYLLIHQSRTYINQQWQDLVFKDYKQHIEQHYPFDSNAEVEVNLADFEQFFAHQGRLKQFFEAYLKPFLDTSKPQWQPKELNHYVMPIHEDLIDELIRANIITSMFFPQRNEHCQIKFSLEKLNLDPIISDLKLVIGDTILSDNQGSASFVRFTWPKDYALLKLKSIEGQTYQMEETGPWAFFKILQKVNVLINEEDNSSLQILFNINGNSGQYLLKTQNQVNPFTPGILNGFHLKETIV